ncbi:thioredoxin-like protein [Mycena floridula]|nr:thioredoxin-like protein [Mycena floridula]
MLLALLKARPVTSFLQKRSLHYLNANPEVFNSVISTKGRLILVDFYAEWCQPCKIISPVLQKLTNDPEIKSGSGLPLDLVTLDIENGGLTISQEFAIRAMPTIVAFRDGKEVKRFVGVLPEPAIRKFLSEL